MYLRARAITGGYGIPEIRQSVSLFQQAIEKDPSFAPAYAGLAEAHVLLSGNFNNDIPEQLAKIGPAAEKAVQLDPLSAESYDALGAAHARQGQWEQSEKSFRRAIEMQPRRPESHTHFAIFFLALGRIDEQSKNCVSPRKTILSSEVHFGWWTH